MLPLGKDYDAFGGFFDPGRVLAVSTADHQVRLVDAQGSAVLGELGTGVLLRGVSQTRKGPLLLVVSDGSLSLVGKEGAVGRVPLPPGPPPSGGTLSPDARRLAVWWRDSDLASRGLLLDVPPVRCCAGLTAVPLSTNWPSARTAPGWRRPSATAGCACATLPAAPRP